MGDAFTQSSQGLRHMRTRRVTHNGEPPAIHLDSPRCQETGERPLCDGCRLLHSDSQLLCHHGGKRAFALAVFSLEGLKHDAFFHEVS